jgi:hypothetical protein
MILKKKALMQLVQEEVKRQSERKNALEKRMKEIEQEIANLDNSSPFLNEFVNAPTIQPQTQTQQQVPSVFDNGNYNMDNIQQGQQEEENESIFDARPGETVIFNFQDVTIKLQRQLDDLFKVVDAAESKKLSDGDYIKIQGNDQLKKGRTFTFNIYRVAGLKYESNPLVAWKVIKNK